MPVMTADDVLAHYGVMGQKWGVRKDRRQLSSDAFEAKNLKRKVARRNVDALSNNELKALTTRMNLERQYKQLNPHVASKGKQYLAASIGTAALGVTVFNMYHSPAGKAAMDAAQEWIKRGEIIRRAHRAF